MKIDTQVPFSLFSIVLEVSAGLVCRVLED